MKYDVLEQWNIIKNCFDNNYYVHGNIRNSKRFMKNEYINSNPILTIEKKDGGYLVHAINDSYFLPDSPEARDDTEIFYERLEISDIIQELNDRDEKIKLTAKKLLSVGDSLISDYIACYRSEEGYEILYPKTEFYNYTYTFPKEDFKLIKECGRFTIMYSKERENCCLYILDFENGICKRQDYKYYDYRINSNVWF